MYIQRGLNLSYLRGHAKIPTISEKVKFSLFFVYSQRSRPKILNRVGIIKKCIIMEDFVIGFLSAVVFSIILFIFRFIASFFQSDKKEDENKDEIDTNI